MKIVNVALSVILLLLMVVVAVYEPDSIPRLLLIAALLLAFGCSKPAREFRNRNFTPNLRLSWLMTFNLALMVAVLLFGVVADFENDYFPLLFALASALGVASLVYYYLKFGRNSKE